MNTKKLLSTDPTPYPVTDRSVRAIEIRVERTKKASLGIQNGRGLEAVIGCDWSGTMVLN